MREGKSSFIIRLIQVIHRSYYLLSHIVDVLKPSPGEMMQRDARMFPENSIIYFFDDDEVAVEK